MSLTSYRTAPPRGGGGMFRLSHRSSRATFFQSVLIRFGGDLLSHVLGRSTIGAAALNFRVREGIGCFACAMTTKPRKHSDPSFVFWGSMLFEPVFYWIKSSLSGH